MGQKGWTILLAVVAGAILGTMIGYLAGKSAWGAVAGASIGAVLFGVTALAPRAVGGVLLDIAAEGCLEGCFSFFVLVLASTVTLGSFVLWQSLAPAALAGIGVLTVWLVAVSMTTSWSKNGSKTFDPLLV